MDLNLTDKTVFITGASSGIGAAAARIFAQEGADVVISYGHNQPGAVAAAETVRTAGRQARLCPIDMTDPDSIGQAVRGLEKPFNQLDVLVLCAGMNRVTPFEDITPQEWRQVFDTNLSGPFFTVQALKPHLNDGAVVILVASVAAQTGNANHMHYAAAKAGLINLTKSLARALAPRVRVNCIAPGITRTPMGENTVSPDYPARNLLFPRFAEPDEIARCIVFMASPAAAFMTGATLDVNGGRYLR